MLLQKGDVVLIAYPSKIKSKHPELSGWFVNPLTGFGKPLLFTGKKIADSKENPRPIHFRLGIVNRRWDLDRTDPDKPKLVPISFNIHQSGQPEGQNLELLTYSLAGDPESPLQPVWPEIFPVFKIAVPEVCALKVNV